MEFIYSRKRPHEAVTGTGLKGNLEEAQSGFRLPARYRGSTALPVARGLEGLSKGLFLG